jgi:hypothetical protein
MRVASSQGVKTVILSAATPALEALEALERLVVATLQQRGESTIRTFHLATTKLAYCQGEFDCWIKTPGRCRAHDAEDAIVQAVHDADNVILIDAITSGGHSYVLKRAQDRMICLLSPFFERREALTHHEGRYEHTANFFALGWMPVADEPQAQTWRDLADANAINMLAPRVGAGVVCDADRAAWPAEVEAMLASGAHPGDNIAGRGELRTALRAAACPAAATLDAPARVRTAAILVGSAKIKGTSVSETLARACVASLGRAGLATDLHVATDFVHERTGAAAAAAIAQADLFLLVTPLYVDALPALAVRALETVVAARAGLAPARFAVIVNCGFPEPEHNRLALRIARHVATRGGYHWSGGLPLGGGGAIRPDRPLEAQHGPAEHVSRALAIALPALASGDDVPPAALEAMMQTPLPDVAYRVLGDLGWRYRAYKNGLRQRDLLARPLDAPTT